MLKKSCFFFINEKYLFRIFVVQDPDPRFPIYFADRIRDTVFRSF